MTFASALTYAQTPAPPPPIRFTVFSAKPIADLTFSPRPNTAAQKVVFYPTARSPRYEYRGAMPLRFVDSGSGEVVAEATIPPEIREPLLLFSPIEAKSATETSTGGMPVTKERKEKEITGGTPVPPQTLRYRIAVLDDSAVRHGPSGLAIINLSGLALSGTVGREAVKLNPGLNPTLTVGRSTKIELRTNFKNRSYQSYAETLQLTPKQRALLILFPPFYAGSLEVQSRLLIDEPK